jgi:hypothetical protein
VTASATATMDLRHGMATGFYRMGQGMGIRNRAAAKKRNSQEGTVSSEPRGWLTIFLRTTRL